MVLDGQGGTPPNCKDVQTVTYTVKPCSSVQEPLQVVKRHKHPIGTASGDSACHAVSDSHFPAGHTEKGGHGSGNCRKNDNPDTIFTRIQHLLTQGGKAALEAMIETLKNEAANQLTKLDIDWENFATDGDEQQKLLDVLSPVLKEQELEVYALDDVKSLWAGIGQSGQPDRLAAVFVASLAVRRPAALRDRPD